MADQQESIDTKVIDIQLHDKLYNAVLNGDIQAVKDIVESGFDPHMDYRRVVSNIQCSVREFGKAYGWNHTEKEWRDNAIKYHSELLHFDINQLSVFSAMNMGHTEIAEYLMQNGFAEEAIWAAAIHEDPIRFPYEKREGIERLTALDTDISKQCNLAFEKLSWTHGNRGLDIVHYLMEQGAIPNAEQARRIFIKAIDNREMTDYFLEKGFLMSERITEAPALAEVTVYCHKARYTDPESFKKDLREFVDIHGVNEVGYRILNNDMSLRYYAEKLFHEEIRGSFPPMNQWQYEKGLTEAEKGQFREKLAFIYRKEDIPEFKDARMVSQPDKGNFIINSIHEQVSPDALEKAVNLCFEQHRLTEQLKKHLSPRSIKDKLAAAKVESAQLNTDRQAGRSTRQQDVTR